MMLLQQHVRRIRARVCRATTLLLLAALPLAAQHAPTVSARAQRLDDAVIAADLLRLDSFERTPRGVDQAARVRSATYAALARDAYERNDDGALTNALLAVAGGGAPLPRVGRRGLWHVVDSMYAPVNRERAASLPVAALEAALVRAQSPLLGAPNCADWDREAARLADQILRAAPAPVVVTVAPARPAPTPQPAPPVAAPAPASAPVPEPAPPVTGPASLSGIPSMVHFALDRSNLAPASRTVLDALVDSLTRYADVRVVLEGHTDLRASVAYNLALSRRRVESVRAYLVQHGIAASRISGVPQGKGRLEVEGTGALEHARNRRVQLRYFMPDGREIPAIMLLDDLQLESQSRPRR